MTTTYTARIEINDRGIPSDSLMDAFANYHPAASNSPRGWIEVTITIPAANLPQAVTTALALARAATPHDIRALEVMTEAEYDTRQGIEPVPDLLSVTEVADQLGVSRQAVLDRIARHTLPATKVGREYAIPAMAIRKIGIKPIDIAPTKAKKV